MIIRILTFRSVILLTVAFAYFSGPINSQTLNLEDYQFISPLPGSKLNLPKTTIIIREGNLIDETTIDNQSIVVAGSKSGNHSGKIILGGDSKSIIFRPLKSFEPGENIDAKLSGKVKTIEGKRLPPILFSFKISDKIITENSQIRIIDPDGSDIFATGNVYFTTGKEYEELGSLENNLDDLDKSPYFGEASLFGAIFAGEKQNYDCNMDKAFRRLLMLNKMYQYRIDAALPDISPVSNCYFLYNGSTIVPDGLKQLVGNFSKILEDGFIEVDKDAFNKIERNLEDKNSRVSFESRCPGLY